MRILWNNSNREEDDDDDLKSGNSTLYVDYNGKYYQLEKISIGSVEQCIQKINALREAGVKCIHFWPISDFEEQIEIFRKEIVSHY